MSLYNSRFNILGDKTMKIIMLNFINTTNGSIFNEIYRAKLSISLEMSLSNSRFNILCDKTMKIIMLNYINTTNGAILMRYIV